MRLRKESRSRRTARGPGGGKHAVRRRLPVPAVSAAATRAPAVKPVRSRSRSSAALPTPKSRALRP